MRCEPFLQKATGSEYQSFRGDGNIDRMSYFRRFLYIVIAVLFLAGLVHAESLFVMTKLDGAIVPLMFISMSLFSSLFGSFVVYIFEKISKQKLSSMSFIIVATVVSLAVHYVLSYKLTQIVMVT